MTAISSTASATPAIDSDMSASMSFDGSSATDIAADEASAGAAGTVSMSTAAGMHGVVEGCVGCESDHQLALKEIDDRTLEARGALDALSQLGIDDPESLLELLDTLTELQRERELEEMRRELLMLLLESLLNGEMSFKDVVNTLLEVGMVEPVKQLLIIASTDPMWQSGAQGEYIAAASEVTGGAMGNEPGSGGGSEQAF